MSPKGTVEREGGRPHLSIGLVVLYEMQDEALRCRWRLEEATEVPDCRSVKSVGPGIAAVRRTLDGHVEPPRRRSTSLGLGLARQRFGRAEQYLGDGRVGGLICRRQGQDR